MRLKPLFYAILALISTFAPVWAADKPAPAPEIATGFAPSQAAVGSRFMVVTANPDATQVAYDILSRGGTAADAAVAAQLVLGLVEPQSSGLGGGALALYYDAAKKELTTLDGRETAPMTAGKHLFRGDDGKPMEFYKASVGGRAVGVPGVPALLEKLHAWKGRMAWRDLFSPAINMAETGFAVSPRLSAQVRESRSRLSHNTDAQLYFLPDSSTPMPEGFIQQNGPYANTLRAMALNGASAFYAGDIVTKIVKTVRDDKNPGLLSAEDFAAYRVKERAPVCAPYRAYKICSMGQPSSGGLTLLSILGMLNHFDMAALGPNNPKAWHVMGESSRLAFADRNYYMADPDKVKTPDTALIDPAYLTARAKLISADKPMDDAMPGTPNGWNAPQAAADNSIQPPSTTHISIIDSYGNALSMTSSIESAFGSHIMVDGVLLNSQLTDFAFEPERDGKLVANRVEGGKRPRSSMTPVIVFDGMGNPVMVMGSAGGSAIIGYMLERIVAMVDWGMDVQTALDISNVIQRGVGFEMEDSAKNLGEKIKAMGHPVEYKDLNSGLAAIQLKDGVYMGYADPRREGVAKGK